MTGAASGESSKAFHRFVDNRGIVQEAWRWPNTSGNGSYGYNSQDVLIPAFLDAYRGQSSDGYEAKKFKPFASATDCLTGASTTTAWPNCLS